MDKNTSGYTDLVTEVDKLVKKICAMATDAEDDTVIRRDLNSIVGNRLTEAYRMRQEAEKEAKMAKAAEECKEKLIDLISTYITEVNPTSGGRARRVLIENYANLTIKMMKDDQSALYVAKRRDPQASKETPVGHVEAMIGALAAANSTSLEDAAKTCVTAGKDQERPTIIKTTAGDITDEELLRKWVRRL